MQFVLYSFMLLGQDFFPNFNIEAHATMDLKENSVFPYLYSVTAESFEVHACVTC